MIIKTQLPLIGLEWRRPQLALDCLALLLTHGPAPIGHQIDDMIVAFLAHMHLSYPDAVDDFLEEQRTPESFRFRVHTEERVETVSELIGGSRLLSFLVYAGVDSPTLRPVLQDVFGRAAEAKDLGSWLDYGFRQVVNVVYGSRVL